MITKPKARKFNIRLSDRPTAGDGPQPGAAEAADGFGARQFPTAAAPGTDPAASRGAGGDTAATTADAAAPSTAAEIAAIKAEGLTGRQLRMARRVAQKHGVEAENDFELVRLLRAKGIDPFKRVSMLEVVAGNSSIGAGTSTNLPQTVPERGPQLPASAEPAEDRRAREIMKIQRDIARRRRRRLALLITRLATFVALPTFLAGYYFYEVATPMYATKSEFVIQQAASTSGAPPSLFSGMGLGGSQDSITVQSYLQSREAMIRLDTEFGFKKYFSDPAIDPIQRLAPDATNEEAYRTYQRNVKISFDPTEGIVKMEVIAPDPELSVGFSRALLAYAEEQVDQLTQRLREDQMAGARQNYEEAQARVLAAQQRVVELQEQRGVLSPEAEMNMRMGQINSLEVSLREQELTLQEMLDNPRPNQTRVEVAERNIERMRSMIDELRAELTRGGGGSDSLARIRGELVVAEGDLQTWRTLLAQSLQLMETARIEANRQVRYLETGVNPVAPDEPTYPRAFENTVVSFLILCGIYLMVSLTASILREQVSA